MVVIGSDDARRGGGTGESGIGGGPEISPARVWASCPSDEEPDLVLAVRWCAAVVAVHGRLLGRRGGRRGDGNPMRCPISRIVRSKTGSTSSMTLWKWPNSSKEIIPNNWVHTATARTARPRARPGRPRRRACAGRLSVIAQRGQTPGCGVPCQGARRHRLVDQTGQDQRDPAGRADGVVGGPVARHGRPVDQGVLVGVVDRPPPDGPGDRAPPCAEVVPGQAASASSAAAPTAS